MARLRHLPTKSVGFSKFGDQSSELSRGPLSGSVGLLEVAIIEAGTGLSENEPGNFPEWPHSHR